MVMQACKLNLPHSSRPSLEVTSFLFEPFSNSLALMQSDSSILLLPSLSPFSPPSPFPLIQPQTLIPPLNSSYCFFRLQSTPNSTNSTNSRVVFAVAGPRHGDSRVLLRFWILRNRNSFVRAKVCCSQKGFVCDDKLGVFSVDVLHGSSVKLVGGVNVFVLHSMSERKIWVFNVKMVGDEEVKLMKSVVIDCTIPICSIIVSMGFLVLGECNGVRVIPLRHILKGGVNEGRKSVQRKDKKIVLQNCVECSENGVCRISGSKDKSCITVGQLKCEDNDYTRRNVGMREPAETSSSGYTGNAEMNSVKSPSKLRSVKLKQDSNVGGTLFVAFNSPESTCEDSSTKLLPSLKAVSIHSLSKNKFLILDSDGDLHLLGLYSKSPGSDFTGHMKLLSRTMKVQMLTVLPNPSTKTQTFWISDGFNTVHVMSLSDVDVVPPNEDEKIENEEMLMQMQVSAIEAVFISEKIQNLVSLSANAILVLGQGTIFAYAIS